ncbi:phosphate regulon sensor histidine kinase PhoR [Aquabacterium sp.]|uniref:phosphate regulon sensor histidine kinase PhoR n=1 Tax=Aquabacterium sp. TaxID=1872578 RepID=UPI002B665A6D|nr:phosphate regulon sensor histidine kinase PhoR [Aquabacterium sp.]HSW07671.1 phosphate regulon sensor histidine kinase PhoR [Aquabacterium sp.]
MNWLLPRLLVTLAALALGTGIGFVIGDWLKLPAVASAIGAALGIALVVLIDALRGHRLMRWLRGAQEGDAPRDAGMWGELGYRIERALRLRERELAQEREQLAQFLSAIEASPNGVLLLDANDQIEWSNAVAADHLGLNAQRDRRQPITNLVRTPAFVAYLQSGDWEQAVSFAGPGHTSTLAVLIRRYGEGNKLVISQDVTERLRTEAMRRDFVANVSHEIRTPLTVLAGFIETMASLPLTEVERQRVLKLMQQQTDRMQVLVSDLLILAQLEGSPRPPADRWVLLKGLLQRVEADARTLSGGRHVLSVADAGSAEIAGTEAELLSAIANLVTNAVRYTPEGGRITVGWQLRPDGSGELDVRDSGIGIAREHLPRLTERFYRVDGSRSRDTGGTGLGLAIVKHVMQRHGGELDIDSEPGKGSRFRLLLPAGRVRSGQPQPLSPALLST